MASFEGLKTAAARLLPIQTNAETPNKLSAPMYLSGNTRGDNLTSMLYKKHLEWYRFTAA